MAHEAGLHVVNNLYRQVAGLVRATLTATEDHKIDVSEGFDLSLRAMMLGSAVTAAVRSLPPDTVHDVWYVLEHGQWTLDESS